MARSAHHVYLINEQGKEIADETFDAARTPSEGMVAVCRRESVGQKYVQSIERSRGREDASPAMKRDIVREKWFYVSSKDAQRAFDSDFTFDYAESFSHGKALVEKEGKMYFLDTAGHLEEVNPNSDPSWEKSDPRYVRSMEDLRKVLDWRGARENPEDGEVSVPLRGDQVDVYDLQAGVRWREAA